MQSRKVFLAEDVLVAFIDRAHPKHLHATAFFRYFAQEHYFLYTNSEIVIEVHKKISKDISSALAKEFLKALTFSAITILSPEENELKSAIRVLLSSISETTLEETLMLVMADKRSIQIICTFSYIRLLFGVETFYLPV